MALNDKQVNLYMTHPRKGKTQAAAAAKAGISVRSGRRIKKDSIRLLAIAIGEHDRPLWKTCEMTLLSLLQTVHIVPIPLQHLPTLPQILCMVVCATNGVLIHMRKL